MLSRFAFLRVFSNVDSVLLKAAFEQYIKTELFDCVACNTSCLINTEDIAMGVSLPPIPHPHKERRVITANEDPQTTLQTQTVQ